MTDVDIMLFTSLKEHSEYVGAVANALWHEFDDVYVLCYGMKDARDLRKYLEDLHVNSDWESVLVLDETQRVVGFANKVPDDIGISSYRPWLANLYVADGFRSRGVAGMIMSKLLEITRGTLYLWTESERMCDWFSKKYGFYHVSTLRDFAGYSNAYIMELYRFNL